MRKAHPTSPAMLSPSEVERLFSDAAFLAGKALFSAYDVQLEPANSHDYEHAGDLNLISVIGFGGNQIRGSLVLGATAEPIALSMPHGASARDWIGELANQLLGRVKTQLMRRGIEFHAVPPAVVSGEHLKPVVSRATFKPILFATPHGVVCLWVELQVTGDVKLDVSLLESEIPDEGDVLLF